MSTSEQTQTHVTFSIDRTFAASPARVFSAFANADAKAQWFIGGEGWTQIERSMDFRVGGTELLKGTWKDGATTAYRGRYYDIVPNERIVLAYDLHMDGTLISVSLHTLEFSPVADGTRLLLTETVAACNGFEDPGAAGREQGTRKHLDRIEAYLAKE